jgi:DUF218 domain
MQRACGGLFIRRPRWSLSTRGWLVFGLLAVLLALTVLFQVHPFLAVTQRLPCEVLVVDGWTPTYTVKQAVAEFRQGGFQRALVVRGVYDSPDPYLSGRHGGDYIANLLVEEGVPREAVQTVFSPVARRDRTYHTALAARDWLSTAGVGLTGITIATPGPHARRSRLLYRRAFGPTIKVGVISLDDRAYDADHWWRSSEGVKEVVSEGAAYLFVRLRVSLGFHEQPSAVKEP